MRVIQRCASEGYTGIANIPAAFMLGYELGDENKKKFFHIYHGNNTPDDLKDDRFHLLKVEVRRHTFELHEGENDPSKEGKILLLIQMTQPIKEALFRKSLKIMIIF